MYISRSSFVVSSCFLLLLPLSHSLSLSFFLEASFNTYVIWMLLTLFHKALHIQCYYIFILKAYSLVVYLKRKCRMNQQKRCADCALEQLKILHRWVPFIQQFLSKYKPTSLSLSLAFLFSACVSIWLVERFSECLLYHLCPLSASMHTRWAYSIHIHHTAHLLNWIRSRYASRLCICKCLFICLINNPGHLQWK